MYARSSTFQGDPQSIDDGIAYVRDEIMPAVQQMDGCVGLAMLADRDSGRCIVTTAWVDEDAMKRSAEGVRPLRDRAGEVFGGTPEVAEWDIAIMHRVKETGDGARTRVIWGQIDPVGMEQVIDVFRSSMIRRMEDLPGFCSVNMMVDRQSGRCSIAVSYEGRTAMEQAGPKAAAMRQEANDTMGIHITEVAEFDLVLAHLRVPETV